MSDAIDRFLEHPVWRQTHRARLAALAECAEIVELGAGTVLFEQLFPAERLWLLDTGAVDHRARREDAWPLGRVDWAGGALGWSGFLPPHRYGTTALVETDATLLRWSHATLATRFYADPGLAVDFLRLVVDSVRRQFEAVRAERLASAPGSPAPAARGPFEAGPGRRIAPGFMTALRRSAFFEQFDDAALERLGREGRPVHVEAGATIVSQGELLGGLWILADGATTSAFAAAGGRAHVRFRSIPSGGAILAGVPNCAGDYVAEATVVATRACWLYRLDAGAIEGLIGTDPEFGRAYMQRCLARLAQLLSAARLSRTIAAEEPELTAVKGVLTQNQTRIPVTSALHKVPHLLSHRLTVGNAFACLKTARETGRYEERAIARTCEDLLENVRAELEFYRDALETYVAVVEAPADTVTAELRLRCDEGLERAFGHLSTSVAGLERLPPSPGHICIMNHLACPPEYEFPNGYHFSFDTAFVSMLLARHYGESPVRVVRRSPGAEYGHSLFYQRLGHITVGAPEAEASEPASTTARERRTGAEAFFEAGLRNLAEGRNLMICPEGSSQRAEDSPARFFSGAFRLAQRARIEPFIVPIAVAGFERRYKDARLTALVQEPFKLSTAMTAAGATELRAFVDEYRLRFAEAVRQAQAESGRMATAARPAVAGAAQSPSSARIS